ncbi:hypothetical protein PLESTB_000768800 [Pleodorina starrii]|uniref:Uncharacterized protein n=1 Tax=Pleodorina starrii TaxID=330485 RepID=A0A9W6BKD8_9CHLO|nr:hypothetical protein PLESTB_000768800 [Pleodorina starrii]
MSSKELRRWVAAAQDSGGQLIRLLVPARPSSLPPDDDSQEAADRASRLAALQLAAALCALQPGGPSISWPTATHQQVTVVVCGKANAALGYKALAANGAKLGFKLGDVKSTVVVLPMQYEELQRTAEAAVSHALQSQGWHRLGTMWVRSNFLATEPGRTAVVPATELSVQPASPSTGTMALGFRHAGMYKYCPVWPLPTPPPPAAPPAPTADAAAATAAATAAAAAAAAGAGESARGDAAAEREAALARLFGDKAALRRAVSRLSETRVTVVGLGVPAYIIALKPPPSNPAAAQRLRDAWLSRFGLRLPTALGGFVAEVAASPDADPDDAQDVPGCCLWIAAADGGGGGGGGLVPVPPAQCTAGPEQVSEQLLKDLVRASSASFAFWGSGGLTSQGEAAPPGAEAALAKRQAASAPAAPLPPAAAAAAAAAAEGADGSGGGENTGWTAAVEVVASGFRAAVSLAPAAQVLRRTIDPDIDGGGASGGGGANFGPVDLALAEALYGDEVAASGDGGGGGSAAAREAILERSSDEALRAAARARAANRATEKAAWGRCRTFWEARKAGASMTGTGTGAGPRGVWR